MANKIYDRAFNLDADSKRGLNDAVHNGQTRLALEYAVEQFNLYEDRLKTLEEEISVLKGLVADLARNLPKKQTTVRKSKEVGSVDVEGE